MKADLKQIALVEAYLAGSLSREDKELVELKMADQKFREQVETQLLLQDRILSLGIIDLIGREERRRLRRQRLCNSGWGAGLLVLIGAVMAIVYGLFPGNKASRHSEGRAGMKPMQEEVVLADSQPLVPPISEELIVPFQEFVFQAEKGATLHSNQSKTTISVAPGAFIDPDGNPLAGEVVLRFREYRDIGDMAPSGIPMEYVAGGDTFNFSSAGMFEMWAEQDGNQVSLAENHPIELNFELVDGIPGTRFFYFDEKQGWQNIGSIRIPKSPAGEIDDSSGLPVSIGDSATGTINVFSTEKNADLWVDGGTELGRRTPKNGVGNNNSGSVGTGGNNPPVPSKAMTLKEKKKHLNLMTSLEVREFGLYNCDRIYNKSSLVVIQPRFVDGSGQEIEGLYRLTHFDLRYNAAFTPNLNYLVMSTKGKNCLLLYCEGQKVYGINQSDLASLEWQKGGMMDIPVEDLTTRYTKRSWIRKWVRQH